MHTQARSWQCLANVVTSENVAAPADVILYVLASTTAWFRLVDAADTGSSITAADGTVVTTTAGDQ